MAVLRDVLGDVRISLQDDPAEATLTPADPVDHGDDDADQGDDADQSDDASVSDVAIERSGRYELVAVRVGR